MYIYFCLSFYFKYIYLILVLYMNGVSSILIHSIPILISLFHSRIYLFVFYWISTSRHLFFNMPSTNCFYYNLVLCMFVNAWHILCFSPYRGVNVQNFFRLHYTLTPLLPYNFVKKNLNLFFSSYLLFGLKCVLYAVKSFLIFIRFFFHFVFHSLAFGFFCDCDWRTWISIW